MISTMDLSSNRFQGPLQDSFLGMDSLFRLDLSRNSFTGVLPASLGNIPRLTNLRFQFNQVEGDVPDEYCDIETLEADCLPQSVFDFSTGEIVPPDSPPDTFCIGGTCCSTCCDRSMGVCEEFTTGSVTEESQSCDDTISWDRQTGDVSGSYRAPDIAEPEVYYDDVTIDVEYYDEAQPPV